MKTIPYFTVFLVMAGFMVNINGQSRQEKKEKQREQYQETVEMIRQGNFIFEARRLFPQGGRPVDLTTNYGFLEVLDSVAKADLPFFGRGYNIEYGGDGGINFSGDIEDPELELNDDKMRISYSFQVRDDDTFRIMMDVGYDGNTSLNVISNKRSPIRYQGDISRPEESE